MPWGYEPRDPEKRLVRYCPLCGYGPFPEPLPTVDELRASFEICPCCGCEYGYSDTRVYREAWLARGAPWRDEREKPENWDLSEQLERGNPDWYRYR